MVLNFMVYMKNWCECSLYRAKSTKAHGPILQASNRWVIDVLARNEYEGCISSYWFKDISFSCNSSFHNSWCPEVINVLWWVKVSILMIWYCIYWFHVFHNNILNCYLILYIKIKGIQTKGSYGCPTCGPYTSSTRSAHLWKTIYDEYRMFLKPNNPYCI